jgi:hypothetical protein
VLEHELAGRAARVLALRGIETAVADVHHQTLGDLAHLCMLCRAMHPAAGLGVAHEDEKLGGIFRVELSVALEAGGRRHRGLQVIQVFLVAARQRARVLSLVLVVAFVGRVLNALAVQSKHIGVGLNGVLVLSDIDARNLVGVTGRAVVAIHCPPRVLRDRASVRVRAITALVLCSAWDARIRHQDAELPTAFSKKFLVHHTRLTKSSVAATHHIHAVEVVFIECIHRRATVVISKKHGEIFHRCRANAG